MNILENKVAVITGTRGARSGHRPGLHGGRRGRGHRRPQPEHARFRALAELRSKGGRAAGLACDVSELAQVEALGAFAVATFGGIHIWGQ